MEIAAHIIGIFAMAFNIISYQFKSRERVLILQLTGATLFAINMFMINAVAGGILNIIAIVRALVYIKVEKIKLPPQVLNGFFILLYIAAYVLSFTVFKTEFNVRNAILELLPVIGMTAMNFGFARGTSSAIRICSFITSPCWLIYNSFNLAIGGILCEAFSITSSVIGIIRHDASKSKETEK